MLGDANANLISAWLMVKRMGFTLTLTPDGKRDGFNRTESDGSVTRLPATADLRRGIWIIHFTISHSAEQSRKLAIKKHRAMMCRESTDNPGMHALCDEGRLLSAEQMEVILDDHLDAGDVLLSADSSTMHWYAGAANASKYMEGMDKSGEESRDARASTDGLLDPEDEHIYKESEAVIKPSQRPHDRQMVQRVRHFKLGHHGPCPGGCDICKQTSGTLRKVMKGGSPVFDEVAGRTFGMDSLYWDVESRHGNKYTVVMRDERTLWIGGFHMAKRSDATRLFVEYVERMRADPEVNCPHFCTRLRLDNAGEWAADYNEFQQACINLGIEVLQPPSKSDHRMNSLAESAVFLTKLHAQRVLLGTRLEWNMWEEAVNYVWFIRQHTVTKRAASPHGKGPAPITELSDNNVDYAECDRRKDYAWPPGTLCLVHNPGKHGGADDITHARYGRVIRMEKDVAVFESLRTPAGNDRRTIFRSKNFSVVHLHEGISALQWAGLEAKNLPKACMPEVDLSRFVTLVELSNLYTGSQTKLPIIKGSSKQGDAPLPGVITIDKATGRIYEEKEGTLHPTDGHVNIVPPGLSDASTESKRIEISTARLVTDPESFISCDVHRLFTSNGGVYRGSVLSYDDDTKFWKVKYDCDETVEEYDVDDMVDYAIRCIEGKSPADGGAAQWIKHCQGANDAPPGPEPEPEPEVQVAPLVDGFDGGWYRTLNNDTFYSVCEANDIASNQQRMYFEWLRSHFKIGNDKKKCTTLFIPNPIGKKSKWTKFKEGEWFPVPTGAMWDRHLSRYEPDSAGNMSAAATSAIQQNVKVILAAQGRRVEALVSETHRLLKAGVTDVKEFEQVVLNAEIERSVAEAYAAGDLPSDSVCWAAVDQKSRATADDQKANKHIDAKGIPIAPKSMIDLESWKNGDSEIWDEAIDKEWDGLNDRDCFEHDLTRSVLRERQIYKNPIGMRMLLETKISDGKFSKAKARNVAQGHKGNLTKGVDYTTVFAAAPDLATGRIIQALCVLFNFVRATMDIMQAYLIGKAEKGQQYPVRYPAGRIREAHRCPITGEERYALLIGNLYGMPTASRVYSIERDRLLLEEMPRRWPDVTIEQNPYEPCLFKIKRKGIGYVSIHVDDCDAAFQYAEDAEFWMYATNELFKTDKQPGIKAVDPEVMLGVTRKLYEKDGVRYVKLGQHWQHQEATRIPEEFLMPSSNCPTFPRDGVMATERPGSPYTAVAMQRGDVRVDERAPLSSGTTGPGAAPLPAGVCFARSKTHSRTERQKEFAAHCRDSSSMDMDRRIGASRARAFQPSASGQASKFGKWRPHARVMRDQSTTKAIYGCAAYEVDHGQWKLVTGDADGELRVWCAETGVCERTVKAHDKGVSAIRLVQPDMSGTTKIVTAGEDGKVMLWDLGQTPLPWLECCVLECRGLTNMDTAEQDLEKQRKQLDTGDSNSELVGSNDVYVAVSVFGKHAKRTSVLDEGGTECAWGPSGHHFRWAEDDFRKDLRENGGFVTVEVDVRDKDHDEASDELGKVKFTFQDGDLRSIISNVKQDGDAVLDGQARWHAIYDDRGKVTGEVKLRLSGSFSEAITQAPHHSAISRNNSDRLLVITEGCWPGRSSASDVDGVQAGRKHNGGEYPGLLRAAAPG